MRVCVCFYCTSICVWVDLHLNCFLVSGGGCVDLCPNVIACVNAELCVCQYVCVCVCVLLLTEKFQVN